MVRMLKILFSIITIVLSIYVLTNKFAVFPYMIIFLGALFLLWGFSELQEKRKSIAYTMFLVSAINIFVSIYTFFTGNL